MTLGKERKRITVGVLVSGILDEFTEYICKGVLHAAKMQDVNVVIFPGKYLDRDLSENRDLMYEYQYGTVFSYARKENIDALVAATDCIGCHTDGKRMQEMMKQYAGIPCALVASKMEGYAGVTYDNYGGIREGLEYLIEKVGCRKFGMIAGPDSNSDAYERKQAFTQVLKAHGIEVTDRMFAAGDLSRRSENAFRTLLDQNPDLEAVFCVNDETAMGFYEELKRRNIVPGRDISVLGYDDTIASAKSQPSLSSVRADPSELGEHALKMALRMLNGEKVESKTIPTKFVMRDSFCKASQGDDEAASYELKNDVESYFEEIFYRCRHEELKETLEMLHRDFDVLIEKISQLFERHNKGVESYIEIQKALDAFLDHGAVVYADMDNLLIVCEKIYHTLKKKQPDAESSHQLRDFFSITYRKIIRAMDYRFGSMRKEEESNNYSMKLFIRDMLQFEKGNDLSYASVLNNLDWLKIQNAFLYIFKKPITHLYREEFTAPDSFYLKAYLREGKVHSVPAIQQKHSLKTLFFNQAIEGNDRYSMALLPLFVNEHLYGLLLCDISEGIFVNGEFLLNQMSSATKMIDLLKANEEIQQQLEESLATLKENNIVLDNLSRSDGLTGILNRRGFTDAAEKLLEKSREEGKKVLVIYVDMNNLKIINDRYGHEEGDISLKFIAETLSEVMKERGIAGRIGGDEFACIADYFEEDKGEALLADIYERFDRYNAGSCKSYNLTVSAGARLLRSSEKLTLKEALTQADERLYEVKKLRSKEVAKRI